MMMRVITVIGTVLGLIVAAIGLQRNCEPLSAGQCFQSWLDWAQSKESGAAAKARAAAENKRRLDEQARRDAIEARRIADEAEAARRAEEARAQAIEDVRKRLNLDQQRRDEQRAQQEEQARRRREAEAQRQAEQRRLEAERARADEARQRQALAARQQRLESLRCATLNEAGRQCCPLGETPELKYNAEGLARADQSGRGWTPGLPLYVPFCRTVRANE